MATQYILDDDDLRSLLRRAWEHGYVEGLEGQYPDRWTKDGKRDRFQMDWATIEQAQARSESIDVGRILDGQPPFINSHGLWPDD